MNIQHQYNEDIPALNIIYLTWKQKNYSLVKEKCDSICFAHEENQITLTLDYNGREYVLATIYLPPDLTDSQLDMISVTIQNANDYIENPDKYPISLNYAFSELMSQLKQIQ